MSDAQREMTLEEWCQELPGSHNVNRELAALLSKRDEHNRMFKDLKEQGIMIEACLGCGRPYRDRDCGCPAGSCWVVDPKLSKLKKRLDRIKEIIEDVDQRCLWADGPVTPTLQEMRQSEISEIYKLAGGKPEGE